MINRRTLLVLVNAIYFKSDWATKFDTSVAIKFQISHSSSIEVPMMRKTETVFYARLDTLSSAMVELPYKGNRIVMQVLLPRTMFGLEDLEAKLKNVDIHELFENKKRKMEVKIRLPKFKLVSTLPLNENLKELGLKNLFTTGAADLGGIASGGLYVSLVIQKALIEVDEEGTVASAATGAVVGTESASGPIVPIMFTADHPFIFFLRDMESGILLFQGRVINPLK